MLAIQKNLSKSFYMLLSLPATAMGFALSVQISALSWILTTQYGLDIHQVGLVWAAGPIAGILGQVIVGIISDNVWFWNGRRRPFILIGGVLAAMMLLALPNIDIVSSSLGISGLLGVAIAVALTLDLSINISFNPTRAIIADVTPEGDARTKGYTWMQTVSGSFGVLAYAVGATWGNFILIYLGAGLVFFLSILAPFFISEPKELLVSQRDVIQDKVSFTMVLMNIKPLWGFIIYDIYAMALQISGIKTDHYWAEVIAAIITLYFVVITLFAKESCSDNSIGFRKVLAAHSFSWIGVQTMFVFIIAFLQDKMPSLSDDDLGKVIAMSFLILSAVSALLPAFVLEPIAKKIGRVKTHTYCIASMAVGYGLVVMFGDVKEVLYLLMALLGIGWSAIISLPFAIMSEKVEQSRMGLYMGLFNLSVVLPQLLVSLAIGLFISKVADKSVVFQISAIALAISALAWTKVQEHSKA
ncbi:MULTISPECIES: MFS transporter [unclassified Colwellia]|uniref:MFS transporter n=1 Tax=unclassified Colwellia TaxID=196834 RepID=UPI0015F3A8EC|nr:MULTISPECIES: MFS transporter [unclassified Colwellia]MBA6365077.1 MFS transporter [Colwellia sp. BRX8-8]MBA6354942.1 MFS transporter [Colwellia sp. BRX8-3]MBA6360269.1 MFS transporter [Colwellia sp. BRX8-6]MBA6367707.1 MFS transporter [Colwellia sp. BRX8-5]MBA6372543.1 MFS transporter [Colwellia sp. BRX8-4]